MGEDIAFPPGGHHEFHLFTPIWGGASFSIGGGGSGPPRELRASEGEVFVGTSPVPLSRFHPFLSVLPRPPPFLPVRGVLHSASPCSFMKGGLLQWGGP